VEKEGFMLELEGESISDISILSGLPVSTLKIRNSSVSDLSPISGMEITNLEVFNCNVTSLSPSGTCALNRSTAVSIRSNRWNRSRECL
jgi:hypothetical protein